MLDPKALVSALDKAVRDMAMKPTDVAAAERMAWLVYENMRTIRPALRADPDAGGAVAMREAAKRVCHEEQMTVWTGEIAGRLSMGGYLRDDATYDDILDIHAALAGEVRKIVESAFSHLELASQEGSEC